MHKLYHRWHAFLLALLLASGCATGPAGSHFTGKDLSGWRQPTRDWQVAGAVALDPNDAKKFVVTPGQGIFVNGGKSESVHFVTQPEFGDVKIHVEFCIPRNSNSGVYVMGRYEVQIYDATGHEQDLYPGGECGGIYPRWINGKNVEGHSPRVNADRPPGQWQAFDITFRAPRFDPGGTKIANAKFVKVVQNGKVTHENEEVLGPTRSPLFENEKATGPLMLQGNHGQVAFRNIRIQPIGLK